MTYTAHIESLADEASSYHPAYVFALQQLFRWRPAQRADFYNLLGEYIDRDQKLQEALSVLSALYSQDGQKWSPTAALINTWIAGLTRYGTPTSELFSASVPRREALTLATTAKAKMTGDSLRELADSTISLSNMSIALMLTIIPFYLFGIIGVVAAWLTEVYAMPLILHMVPKDGNMQTLDAVRGITGFVASNGFLLLGLVSIVPILVFFTFPNWARNGRHVADKFWPYTIYARFTATAWLRSLSELLAAELNLHTALRTMKPHASPYLGELLDTMLERNDTNIAQALQDANRVWPNERFIRALKVIMTGTAPDRELRRFALADMKALEVQMQRMTKLVSFALQFIVVGFSMAIMMLSFDMLSSFT